MKPPKRRQAAGRVVRTLCDHCESKAYHECAFGGFMCDEHAKLHRAEGHSVKRVLPKQQPKRKAASRGA